MPLNENHEDPRRRESAHHGITHRIARSYNNQLHLIGEFAGGRANSGRVGRYCRGVRIVSTAVSFGVVIAGGVIVGTSIFTGGAAIPAWLVILGGSALVANGIAIVIGSGANHHKIGPYYDAQLGLHAALSDLYQELGMPPRTLPHGIIQYYHHGRPQFWMVVGRQAHNVNAVGGSVLSGITGLASIGVATLSPETGFALFTLSRISATISAGGASATSYHRLKVYKKILKRFAAEYRKLSMQLEPNKARSVRHIIKGIVARLNLAQVDTYSNWVLFYIYKGLFTLSRGYPRSSAHSPLRENARESVINALVDVLRPLLKKSTDKAGMRIFSRKALMSVDAAHKYTVKINPSYKDKLTVLDAMPILEKIIQRKVLENSEPNFAQYVQVAREYVKVKQINAAKDVTAKHLELSLVMALSSVLADTALDQSSSDELFSYLDQVINPLIAQEISRVYAGRTWSGKKIYEEEVLESYEINKEYLSKQFPLVGHAHGADYHDGYHPSKLTDEITKKLRESMNAAQLSERRQRLIRRNVETFPEQVQYAQSQRPHQKHKKNKIYRPRSYSQLNKPNFGPSLMFDDARLMRGRRKGGAIPRHPSNN